MFATIAIAKQGWVQDSTFLSCTDKIGRCTHEIKQSWILITKKTQGLKQNYIPDTKAPVKSASAALWL